MSTYYTTVRAGGYHRIGGAKYPAVKLKMRPGPSMGATLELCSGSAVFSRVAGTLHP